jgi:hypothetical protein
MIIRWSGPYPLLPATLEPNGLPEKEGVYLWVLRHENGQRLVHYIGYASDIRCRQYQHMVRCLGGGDWVPRFPIGSRVENRYSPPPQRGARNKEYYRLKEYVEALPSSAEEVLAYLKSVEIFTHLTSVGRDVEYAPQMKFMSLAAAKDPRANFCYDVSLQGSRRVDAAFAISTHELPPGITIAGISD